MGQFWGLLALKVASLIGSIASTIGFVGIFAFKETLGPFTSQLIIGGFALIAVAEGASYLLVKRMARADGADPKDA